MHCTPIRIYSDGNFSSSFNSLFLLIDLVFSQRQRLFPLFLSLQSQPLPLLFSTLQYSIWTHFNILQCKSSGFFFFNGSLHHILECTFLWPLHILTLAALCVLWSVGVPAKEAPGMDSIRTSLQLVIIVMKSVRRHPAAQTLPLYLTSGGE